MSELQSPNWNEAKVSPEHLMAGTGAALQNLAKEHNSNPSKFMAKMNGSGDTFGFGDMRAGNAMYDREEKGATSSQYLMMGKTQSKKNARVKQLSSQYDAMGLPKSYKQMKEDSVTHSRIMTGGRIKKNADPFSGGGDHALMENHKISRQSLGVEGGYICPQNMTCSEHIARQLGGADLFNTLMDAGREKVTPHEYRVLNGAVNGDDGLKDAAKQVSDDKKIEFVTKLDDPKTVATTLLSEDETTKVVKPKLQPAAPKPPGMDAPKPSNGSGLMDA
jgi:hypothetical protein